MPSVGPAPARHLGAGLRGRSVGPLLRRRVDRGAELWRDALAERPDARIVVSGGRGRDEVRTEASAMVEHLVQRAHCDTCSRMLSLTSEFDRTTRV